MKQLFKCRQSSLCKALFTVPQLSCRLPRLREADTELLHCTQNLPHQLAAMCLPSQVLNAGQLIKCSHPSTA